MYRKFIATITAAAIALTAIGAVPARAGENDTARVVAAILGLAVVGKIIHDKKKDRDANRHEPAPVQQVHKQHPPRYDSPRYDPPRYDPPRYDQQYGHKPQARPLPERVNRKLLPGQCLRSLETRHGKVRMFGNRCLQRNYSFAHRLPQHCNFSFKTRDGYRRGYEARCLRDAGYRLARG